MSLLLDALKRAEAAKRSATERSEPVQGDVRSQPQHPIPAEGSKSALALEDDTLTLPVQGAAAAPDNSQTLRLDLPFDAQLKKPLHDAARLELDWGISPAKDKAKDKALETPFPRAQADTTTHISLNSSPSFASSETAALAQQDEQDRQLVRNAFIVKQGFNAKANMLWALPLALLLLAALAFAWLRWQPVAPPALPAPQVMTGLSEPGLSTDSSARTNNSVNSVPPSSADLAIPPLILSTSLRSLASAQDKPATSLDQNNQAVTPDRSSPPPLTSSAKTAPAIRLTVNTPRPNLLLNRAYEFFQGGQLDAAFKDYTQVLRADANNIDALLGLAAVALRQNQLERAAELYLRVLEADPSEVNAQAGLLNLNAYGDPAQTESRLKTLLTNQPDAPALNFALGNLYAHQRRWSDAQQAYFHAYSAEPNNADYLLNLAISLDQLHQSKLAATYYSAALSAADTQSARFADHFDRQIVEKRLAELRQF
ncbi:MAG: tetratricopeptide repeat protein [Pseudomonadota bacterium]